MDYFAALDAFTRSVELGSFSKAAEERAAKVSTVSRQVRALEDDVGAALFNRSTRRLQLTEAGTALYERATHILAELDVARNTTRELNSRPQGLLRVIVPRAFGQRVLTPYLPEFLNAYPDIRLDLIFGERTVDLIEIRADVAIRIGALHDSSLIAKRLGPHECIPVASPAYCASRAPVERPDDLRHRDCLTFVPDTGTEWFFRPVDDPGGAAQNVAVIPRIQTNDLHALMQISANGLGIALLPRWLVATEISNGSLVALLPQWLWTTTAGPDPAIWAVYPPKRVVSPKVRVFIDFVAKTIRQEDWWR